MKSLKILLLVVSILVSQSHIAAPFADLLLLYPCAFETNPYSIIMEDDIFLRTDSGDPGDPVEQVEVFQNGQLIFVNSGCSGQVCISDLSGLTGGQYEVVATTLSGNTFSAGIKIK